MYIYFGQNKKKKLKGYVFKATTSLHSKWDLTAMQIKISSYANKNATMSIQISVLLVHLCIHKCIYVFTFFIHQICSPFFQSPIFSLFPRSVLNGPDPKNGHGKFNKRTHNITIC